MAKHLPKDFIVQCQAEGTPTERRAEDEEAMQEAKKLERKLPAFDAGRSAYVRKLTVDVLLGRLDSVVFEKFLDNAGLWREFELVAARAKIFAANERLKEQAKNVQANRSKR